MPEPANPPSWKRKAEEGKKEPEAPEGAGGDLKKQRISEEREKKFNTGGFFVPDRVKDALLHADNFEKFRRSRKFRYLHMFSGKKDILAEAIAAECKSHRLEFEAESDRKKNRSIDLSSERAYREIGRTTDQGEWDGFLVRAGTRRGEDHHQ